MRFLDVFWSYLWWEHTGTCYFYAVIINSKTDCQIIFLPMAVTKSIDKSLPYCMIRYFKLLLPYQTTIGNFTTKRKMFETEGNTCF